MFRSFGTIKSEAQLQGGEKLRRRNDPQWEERRCGNSDVDWGEEDNVEGEDDSVVDVSNGVGTMDQLSCCMQQFLFNGMLIRFYKTFLTPKYSIRAGACTISRCSMVFCIF